MFVVFVLFGLPLLCAAPLALIKLLLECFQEVARQIGIRDLLIFVVGVQLHLQKDLFDRVGLLHLEGGQRVLVEVLLEGTFLGGQAFEGTELALSVLLCRELLAFEQQVVLHIELQVFQKLVIYMNNLEIQAPDARQEGNGVYSSVRVGVEQIIDFAHPHLHLVVDVDQALPAFLHLLVVVEGLRHKVHVVSDVAVLRSLQLIHEVSQRQRLAVFMQFDNDMDIAALVDNGPGHVLVGAQYAPDVGRCRRVECILVDEYLVPCLASKVLLKLCVAVVFGLDVVFPDLFFVIDLLPLLARRVLFGRAMRGALRVSGSGELVE